MFKQSWYRNLALIFVAGALLLAGCSSPPKSPPVTGAAAGVTAKMYSLPGCECCHEYADYLRKAGLSIEAAGDFDAALAEKYPLPLEMRSCHIAFWGDYFVEGHIPLEGVVKLLNEKPDIDGIVLPGMPNGSPGMPGIQTEQFVVFAVSGAEITEFMRIYPK